MLGLPGDTVGPAVEGFNVVGLVVVELALGLPGDTVGPGVDGSLITVPMFVPSKDGFAVVGPMLGLPGDTVGPAVEGFNVVGPAVVGLALGLPGDTGVDGGLATVTILLPT